MKMIILGAGIAGTMAYNYFRELSPVVYEKENSREAFTDHKALMRVKDESSGLLIGRKIKEISVENWIWYKGSFYSSTNPLLNNLYSMKVTGEIEDRSINNTGKHKRFLFSNFLGTNDASIKFNHKAVRIYEKDKKIIFATGYDSVEENYDVCISTIPIFTMAGRIIDQSKPWLNLADSFKSRSIYCYRVKIKVPSNKNYTVYIPDSDFAIYRISLQENEILVESALKLFQNFDEIYELCRELFGLKKQDLEEISEVTEIKHGKIIEGDRRFTKEIMCTLTEDYGIYSLGRYAIWKNIHVDDLLQDLKKIREMINSTAVMNRYDLRKEQS